MPAKPHPIQILTHTLDTPTVHHLATVISAPSPDHFWQEVAILNPMKLKCFMKLLEANEFLLLKIEIGLPVAHGHKIKLEQIRLDNSTKLFNYVYEY